MKEYTTPQGFRDVLADEAAAREAIARKVKEVLDYYNELEAEGSRVRGKEKEVKKDVM